MVDLLSTFGSDLQLGEIENSISLFPSLGTVELLTGPFCCSSNVISCGFSVSWIEGAFSAALSLGSFLEHPFFLVPFPSVLIPLHLRALPLVLASPLNLPPTLPPFLERRLMGSFLQLCPFCVLSGPLNVDRPPALGG